jgi:hypothetical protein
MGWLLRPVTVALLLFALPASAADRSLEYAVKAAFLYKFASFVDWPPGSFESPSSPFNLCVVGADPFGGRIRSSITGQTVGSHPIVLIRLAKEEPRSNCHAMFVSGSDRKSASEALNSVRETPTLTVTDSALGPTAGIIHFVLADDRVSFDIDNAAAARAHLVISSKLLALARRVNAARPAATP